MANIKNNQSFVMNFEGIKFVPAVKKNGKTILVHKHIDPKYLTDAEAIEMLTLGALSGNDFKVLPNGYKGGAKPKSKEFTIEALESVLENGEFNQMRAVAKGLGLDIGKNPKSKALKAAIEKVILKMIDEKAE